MNQNPLDQIQSYYDEFTKTDKDIAVWIINNPILLSQHPIETVALETGTSKAALIRFCKKIGYTGFAEFKFDLSRFLTGNNAEVVSSYSSSSPLIAITQAYSGYILEMQHDCNMETINRIVRLFLSAKRVKIFGRNRTYNSALQFRQRLSRIGYDAEASGDAIDIQDISETMTPKDLVILFTTHNHGHFFDDSVKSISDNGCPIVCITVSQTISWRKLCREYVVLPRISKDSKMDFLDDQPLLMIYGEILIDVIAKTGREKHRQ